MRAGPTWIVGMTREDDESGTCPWCVVKLANPGTNNNNNTTITTTNALSTNTTSKYKMESGSTVIPGSQDSTASPGTTITNNNNNKLQNAGSTTSLATTFRLDKWNERKDMVMSNLSAKWHSDDMIQRREQMRQGWQTLGHKIQKSSQDIGSKIQQDVLGSERTMQVQQGLQKVGNTIQKKFHISKLQPQDSGGLTNQLEMLNERMKEEAMRRDVRREAEEACLETMRVHLDEFLKEINPNGTYEDWILALHPENTQDATLLQGMEYMEVDARFYVEESDHRRLWNQTVQDIHRQVPAKARMWGGPIQNHQELLQQQQQQQQPVVDLLGDANVGVSSQQQQQQQQQLTVNETDTSFTATFTNSTTDTPSSNDPFSGELFGQPTVVPSSAENIVVSNSMSGGDLISF